MRLVLWDIDHTLIETGGVGSEVFRFAFERITGKSLVEMPDPTGLTERSIFERACRGSGVDQPSEFFAEFAIAQAAEYRRRAEDLRNRGRILPGVGDILAFVEKLTGVLQSVLSGNPRVTAKAKLEAFDLDRYLNLEMSAGGDDDEHRPALVPVVWQRVYGKFGVRFTGADTVLVGDSPADIATAHANGCRVVAVATGKTSIEDLMADRPDAVLRDLRDTASVLDALLR